MWFEAGVADPVFTDTLELDLSTVLPSLAGPKRPQDRVLLSEAAAEVRRSPGRRVRQAGRRRPRVHGRGREATTSATATW